MAVGRNIKLRLSTPYPRREGSTDCSAYDAIACMHALTPPACAGLAAISPPASLRYLQTQACLEFCSHS